MSLQGFASREDLKALGRAVVYELRARGGLSSNRPLLYWVPSSEALTVCDRWRAHHYSLVGEIFTLDGNDQQWQVVRMASSRLDHRQHPQILAVPFPSRGLTMPTTLDLSQARFGSKWQPLPPDLVLTIREGDDPHSSDMDISDDDLPIPSSAGSCLQTHPPPHQQARDFLLQLMREGVFLGGPSVDEGGARPGPSTGLSDGPSAPVTVGDMASNSAMEISDGDLPPPSSVGSCLQTHPPTHQEANDFLSSLLLAPDGEGVLPGDGPVDEEAAGVCPGARDVDTVEREDPPPLSARQQRRRRQKRSQQIARGLLPAPVHREGDEVASADFPLLPPDPPAPDVTSRNDSAAPHSSRHRHLTRAQHHWRQRRDTRMANSLFE